MSNRRRPNVETNMKLNPEQQAAADFQDGICCVIAIPGSGKTLTLSKRIETLVKKYSVDPSEILAVSFTKSASEAIRQKLAPSLNELSSRVHLATIHSFCHFLLRNEGRVFEILSGRDQIIFMRDIMRRLKAKELSIGMVLREISLGKNNMVSVEEFRCLYEGDKSMQKIADIYEAYDREKAKRLQLDFDDLLVETHRLLTENEAVREKYRGIFRHLLVDEWQDTNVIQAEILKILVDGKDSGTSFYVVGDDFQAIFNFNGASISNILNFHDMFPNAKQMFLTRSYRSTPQILRACQNLIRHNTKKIDKELRTNNSDGEDVIVLESSNEQTEAGSLVNEIRELVDRRGFAYTDIACLYRCNFQSRVIEEALSQHKIPYHVENGLNFYARREVKVLLDYLRLISNPDSEGGDEALKSVINVPNRYLGRKFMAELDSFRADAGIHLYEKLKSMPVELPYLRKNIREFIQLIDPFIADAETLYPAELIQLLRSALDYDRVVVDSDLAAPDDPKVENINQLVMAATRFNDVKSFLDYTDSFQDEAVTNSRDGVRLSSIHRSKGLEWPVVFCVGMIEGLLPSKKGLLDLESERRVAFVAISRAMKLLYLSHSLTYLGTAAKRSIFLDEILGNVQPPSRL
jgi:DNA helicase II / ATP-dependent DNA helicase PcrA